MPQDLPANRLAQCTSPYLLQHARNPVDWYPWGPEALDRARAEGCPIFLSIGYHACHWCHVMERESFESPEVAAFLNAHFVSVKVDREERPDLDELYMGAVHALGLRGGWPLSVWLTPDLKPFYGGTYFPPQSRPGMPGFLTVLRSVQDAWASRREAVLEQAAALTSELERQASARPGPGLPGPGTFTRALDSLRRSHDPRWGGFGPAPKFPAHMAVRLLLRRGGDSDRAMARHTLRAMAAGGIRDHLGGGFSRYSVDARWQVPHFEKMLYDNALLTVAYLEGFQAFGAADFAEVARETMDYLLRDLRDPAGGFHASEDADSEGEEGRFYTFTPEEVAAVLEPEAAALFCRAYGIDSDGNFEGGRSVLHRLDALDEEYTEAVEASLARSRKRLFQARERRVRPAKDDKVLAAWNGLALSALARGARVLGEPRYLQAARACAAFLLESMVEGGRLYRVWRQGRRHTPGFLEDYAAVAQGLVDLYETDFEVRWLRGAEALAERILQDFRDPAEGSCFAVEEGQPDLLLRQKPVWDGAIPSGNSLAARAFLHLARLLDRSDFQAAGEAILAALAPALEAHPAGHLALLEALDFLEGPPLDLVFAGDLSCGDGAALLEAARGPFLPRAVFSRVESDPELPRHRGRSGGAEPRIFPCNEAGCGLPILQPEALRAWIAGQKNPS